MERDVQADSTAMAELRNVIGRLATPTIVIGGEVLLGFAANRAKIEELLRQSQAETPSTGTLQSSSQAQESEEERTKRETMDKEAEEILKRSETVAMVGLSPDPERPSHKVARYLRSQGYRVIPINPNAEKILGERSHPNLTAVPDQVDVVDIFRRPEHVPPIVEEAIAKGVPAIWMQEGVINEEAADRARAAGLLVVMDRCMYKEHFRLKQEGKL